MMIFVIAIANIGGIYFYLKTKSKTKYKNLHQVQSLSHYMQDLHLMQDFA